MLLLLVLSVGIGLILGSFTNVLILRHGVEGLGGRSHCPGCNTQLRWFELIPLLSYLMLRGRCRSCARRISVQYPLVEVSMAVLCIGIGLSSLPIHAKIVALPILVLLVAITVYDLYYTLIPDAWSYSLAFLSFVYGIMLIPARELSDILLFLVAGPVVALPLATLWYVSRGEWMGLGDAKLVLGFGWLVGLRFGVIALGIAFVSGAIVGVSLLAVQRVLAYLSQRGITSFRQEGRGLTMRSEVPFGPFLVFGLVIVWISQLYHIDLLMILGDFLSLNSWS